VEALAILKDYVSPWPVDADGMSIVNVDVDGAEGNAAKASTVGQASDKVGLEYLEELPGTHTSKNEPRFIAVSIFESSIGRTYASTIE
jgi:hypothetical protein